MKRFLFLVVSLFAALQLLSLSSPSPTIAQTIVPMPTGTWWNQSTDQFAQRVQQAPETEIFGERYTFAQINWILNSLNLILNPINGMDEKTIKDGFQRIQKLITDNQTPAFKDFAVFGIPGLVTYSISDIYLHPPASGFDSVNHTLAKFDLAQPVQAQGYGFTATSAIRTLWAASRNMAFLVIILLLIVAGFMIMFRVKINPQTVISIQLMIPRLIITLVAITFSYAIAGLAIDLVYLLLGFIISILHATGAIGTNGSKSAIDIFSWFATPSYFSRVVLIFIIPLLEAALAGGLVSFLIGGMIGGLGAAGTAFLTALVIVSIVVLLFLGWLLLKVWWMMVKTYMLLLFTIIVGPWQIMLGLIPSGDPKSSLGFGGWFRTLLSHVSVFLVVPLMFLMVVFFWSGMYFGINIISPIGVTNLGLNSNFPTFPMLGNQGTLFGFIMGYSILALIPKVAQMVQEAIKAPQFKYGNALREPLGDASRFLGSDASMAFGGRIIEGVTHGRIPAADARDYMGMASDVLGAAGGVQRR